MARISTILAFLLLFLSNQDHASAQYWKQATLPAPYDKGYYLDIYFLPSDPQYAWACDQHHGYIVRSTDGGNSWKGVSISNDAACHLEYIQFLTRDTGYVSGPCGVYKSVDGGASWNKLNLVVAPDTIPAGSTWGGWFRDVNTGWITGGGCGRNTFYRTTDGGATWKIFQDTTQKDTKPADPLWQPDMPAGMVLAIGAGALWMSTDDGATWKISARTGTTYPWHEEIARFGRSILVPNATSECDNNAGGVAGMRFSVDNGMNWRNTNVPGNGMFGSWLLDSIKGWVSGYAANVYYTADAGANWQKRNCGLDNRNMDDIFFLNDSTGWVVGDGIFHLAPALRRISDTALIFASVCPQQTRRDTAIVTNLNFFPSPITATISGPDADLFGILNPPTQALSCTPTRIIVEYTSARPGSHTATLTIKLQNPDTTFIVALRGERRESSAYPKDTLVVFNARVGVVESRSLTWTARFAPNEYIFEINKVSGDTGIRLNATTPLTITSAGALTTVTAILPDTGWYSAVYRVTLGPCFRDTLIHVRVYGVTPIINSIQKLDALAGCDKTITLRVPVKNTGNAALDILSVGFSGANASSFRATGWTSRKPIIHSLAVNESDTLLIQCTPQNGIDIADLIIANNDYSLNRGVVSAYKVALKVESTKASIRVSPTTLMLGNICPGQSVSGEFDVINSSLVSASVSLVTSSDAISNLTATSFGMAATQSRSITFKYTPTRLGFIQDTIRAIVTPCDTTLMVIIKATVSEASLSIAPVKFDTTVDVGTMVRHTSLVTTNSDSVYITTIRANPVIANVKVVPARTLPLWLRRGDTLRVNIEATSAVSTTYKFKLDVRVERPCTKIASEDVSIRFRDNSVVLSKDVLSMAASCIPELRRDSTSVSVKAADATLQMNAPVLTGLSDARIVSPTAPVTLQANKPVWVVVEYMPTATGSGNGTITFGSIDGTIAIEIPVETEFTQVGFITKSARDFENGSGVDFGLVAACDPVRDSVVAIITSGFGKEAVINVDGPLSKPGLELVGPWPKRIAAGDTAFVIVRCTPGMLSAGPTSLRTVLVDETCGMRRPIDVTVTSRQGKLMIDPAEITLSTIELGGTSGGSYTISNPTSIDHTITGFDIQPSDVWRVKSALLGQVIPPDGSLTVDIEFKPTVSGQQAATLTIQERGECISTLTVAAKGRARDPLEPPSAVLTLRADGYSVNPGTQMQIPVWWDGDITEAVADSVAAHMFLSPYHFRIDTILPGTVPGTFSYTEKDGDIHLVLHSFDSALAGPGVFAYIHGQSSSALPDSTPIAFVNVSASAKYDLTFDTKNGFLIVDACGPRFMLNFMGTSSVAVSITPASTILVSGVAQEHDDLDVTISTMSGATVYSGQYQVVPGDIHIEVPGANLSSGVYFVSIGAKYGVRYTTLLSVVK